jgi:uroporphyrin-III C-methyltransferase/precorrin-2 dehydrogenase/sirohydrochlorin ferrochelatase
MNGPREPSAVPPTYPLTLRVAGRRVLVVGGGAVATRRALGLLDAGATVVVVAPQVGDELAAAAGAGRLTWQARGFTEGDLDGAWLVFTATGVPAVDDSVSAAAESRQVWCGKGGDPERATAWVPAVATVDDVVVAVNAGRDPRRAARLRDAVAAALDSGDLPLRRRRGRPAAAGPDETGEPPGRGERVTGSVALVGGGPGDPGLITTRGRRLLAQADVVVTDRLGPRALLDDLDDDVVVIDVGKTPDHHPVPQHEINALLVVHARAGRRVVRLKGGDPYVFGRGGEELSACEAAGVPVEVVPGVTSAISVPAAVGIPVTHRGLARGFTVLTAHEDLAHVPADDGHTLVLLMGVKRLAETCAALTTTGRSPSTPVAVIEDGYGPRQRVTLGTLGTIAQRAVEVGVRPPAVTVIGSVVRLAPGWPAEPQG